MQTRWLPLVMMLLAAMSARADDEGSNVSKIWNGVFTAAQADRGRENYDKNCSNCHQLDLNGTVRAPSLRGDRFLKNWENGSANVLFIKLRDSMPATYPDSVPEAVKIDILSYLLQVNGFPAGKTELTLDQNELDDIQIVQKGQQAAPNFALVRVIGCLSRGAGNRWMLTHSSEPVVTKDERPGAASLKDVQGVALGTGSFELVSAAGFKPESHQGRKVEARGLIYRDPGRSLLNLTSIEDAGTRCGE
jgi:S-disulfanyl-L-cysteine oxidoreductase SoxD